MEPSCRKMKTKGTSKENHYLYHFEYIHPWNTFQVTLFNTKLKQSRVLFEDGTEGYIVSENINGVDIQLLS